MSDEQSTSDIERLTREVDNLQSRLFDTSRRERVWRRLHDAHAAGGYEALVQAVLPEAWTKGGVPDWGPLIAKVAGAIERERLLRAAARAVVDAATPATIGDLAAVLRGDPSPQVVARLLAPEKPATSTGEGDGA